LAHACKFDNTCPVKGVFAPAVDKWSLFCLYNLAYNKVLRFNKLKNYIPGISARMLSVTLKKTGNGRTYRAINLCRSAPQSGI